MIQIIQKDVVYRRNIRNKHHKRHPYTQHLVKPYLQHPWGQHPPKYTSPPKTDYFTKRSLKTISITTHRHYWPQKNTSLHETLSLHHHSWVTSEKSHILMINQLPPPVNLRSIERTPIKAFLEIFVIYMCNAEHGKRNALIEYHYDNFLPSTSIMLFLTNKVHQLSSF